MYQWAVSLDIQKQQDKQTKILAKPGILHVTSSPYFPRVNEELERVIQCAKQILQQRHPFWTLPAYRATKSSPIAAKFAFGHQLHVNLDPSFKTSVSIEIAPLSLLFGADFGWRNWKHLVILIILINFSILLQLPLVIVSILKKQQKTNRLSFTRKHGKRFL